MVSTASSVLKYQLQLQKLFLCFLISNTDTNSDILVPAGRKRWVVYKDTFDYNPTSSPAEWHGWLNYVNDYPPTKYDYKKPIYAIEHFASKTGTPEAYAPKGSWANTQKRSWKKYEAWKPQ